MMSQDVTNIYKQNQVNTASPKELLILLYEGCIKFLRLAEVGIEENKIDLVNKNLIKAQNIISELLNTLDTEVESDVTEQLASLYEFFLDELLQANIDKDVNRIIYVREQMRDLLEAWKRI